MTARATRLFAVALLCAAFAPGASWASAAGSAFAPGEQLVYRLTYLGIHAASARISVGEAQERSGQQVWPLVVQTQTESLFRLYPVNDRFVSWWAPEAQRSLGFVLAADENHQRRRQSVTLGDPSGRAQVTMKHEGKPAEEKEHEIDPAALDIASATFALRNRALAVGQVHELPVFTGSKQFSLRFTVESIERIKTEFGEREVFRARVQTAFGGKLKAQRDMRAFITTDPSHVVVKLEAELGFGSIVADLTGWKPGQPQTASADAVKATPGG